MFVDIAVAALGAALVITAAEPAPAAGTVRAPIEDILATVDGEPITRRDVDIAYQTFQARQAGSRLAIPPTAEPTIKKRLVQELIDRELLYREALARDIEPSEEEIVQNIAAFKTNEPGANSPPIPPSVARTMTDTELASAVKQFLALQQLAAGLSEEISVTSEDILGYYNANKSKFHVGEEVHVRHILLKTEPPRDEANAKEEIERIRAEIEAGEDFAELARKYSDCPSADRGGDLGRFGRNVMTKAFENTAFSTTVGSVSEPVKTWFGYHLLKVEAHDQPRQKPFEEVQEQIDYILRRSRTDMAMQRLSAKLRPQGNVWVKDK